MSRKFGGEVVHVGTLALQTKGISCFGWEQQQQQRPFNGLCFGWEVRQKLRVLEYL